MGQLVDYLNAKAERVDAIHCVDWGICQQAVSLCDPDLRGKFRDDWPAFKEWAAGATGAERAAQQLLAPNTRALYLFFTPANGVFPAAQRNFLQMNERLGDPADPDRLLPHRLAAVYQVYEVTGNGRIEEVLIPHQP